MYICTVCVEGGGWGSGKEAVRSLCNLFFQAVRVGVGGGGGSGGGGKSLCSLFFQAVHLGGEGWGRGGGKIST